MPQFVAEEEGETFLRSLVLPQEDCLRLGVAWTGGWRWFRSPNVVCLEQYRKKKLTQVNLKGPPSGPKGTAA
jgi:hypothetical protein